MNRILLVAALALFGVNAHAFGIPICSPEVVNGNLQATDRTLMELADSQTFADATEFQKSVQEISSYSDSQQKLSAYLQMIGVDANDSAMVADFVGAREVRPEWVQSLEHNAKLTPRQADKVVLTLNKALRGGLR